MSVFSNLWAMRIFTFIMFVLFMGLNIVTANLVYMSWQEVKGWWTVDTTSMYEE